MTSDSAPSPTGQLDEPSRHRPYWRQPRPLLLTLGFVLIVAGIVVVARGKSVSNENRPNILVIMTDDQSLESMRVMPKVKELLAAQGATYTNYYTTTPNCCPSRAGYYSGRYPHNNGVRDNIPPAGGAKAFIPVEGNTLSVWLQEAGYHTAHVGKYLNGWGNPSEYPEGVEPRPGWSRWFGLIDPFTYTYFEYKVSVDGEVRSYRKAPQDYQTDVLGEEVLRIIDDSTSKGQPFFISFTPVAPHVGASESGLGDKPVAGISAVPAPRHAGAMQGEQLPRSPSMLFDDKGETSLDVQSKPPLIRQRVREFPVNMDYALSAYRDALASLLAVDEWVARIHQELRDRGQLDNTVIIFTSDNGVFNGEHGLMQKNLPYEEAHHLPLYIRGPGFPAGSTASQPALNIDLAPTILVAAGLDPQPLLDGRDLKPLANDAQIAKGRAILLENFYPLGQEPLVQQVRVENWSYTAWANDRELYDLATDPYQMVNLVANPAYGPTIQALQQRLDGLSRCAGKSCEDSDARRRG